MHINDQYDFDKFSYSYFQIKNLRNWTIAINERHSTQNHFCLKLCTFLLELHLQDISHFIESRKYSAVPNTDHIIDLVINYDI